MSYYYHCYRVWLGRTFPFVRYYENVMGIEKTTWVSEFQVRKKNPDLYLIVEHLLYLVVLLQFKSIEHVESCVTLRMLYVLQNWKYIMTTDYDMYEIVNHVYWKLLDLKECML